MNPEPPIYIDATMLYRWRHLAPVGIVRLERMLTSHLRFRSELGSAEYVIWDRDYRPASLSEEAILDQLLQGELQETEASAQALNELPVQQGQSRRMLPALRRTGLKAIAKVPDHIRPFAEQAAWSMATLGVESGRYASRARARRKLASFEERTAPATSLHHRVDFSLGGDLVALGLGWEYIDHEAMYLLSRTHGIRIHMPAFDLIPVVTPQMNVGQSHLVHRYYAEMAHYADSVTSISEATEAALREFYALENLPVPHLSTNPLPGFVTERQSNVAERGRRRHRFQGEQFVLTVSTVEIRKNHLLLAKIWAECIREGIQLPRLVIVGRVGWDVNELMNWVFHSPELSDRCTIVSDVEDDELVELYSDALFTLFPSRVEGWGLPITESLTYGKACIHSTDPAQLEASQGLMPAYHPDDFVSWKAAIVRAVTDSDYRAELEATIARHYVPRTTDEYCLAFENVLADRRQANS